MLNAPLHPFFRADLDLMFGFRYKADRCHSRI